MQEKGHCSIVVGKTCFCVGVWSTYSTSQGPSKRDTASRPQWGSSRSVLTSSSHLKNRRFRADKRVFWKDAPLSPRPLPVRFEERQLCSACGTTARQGNGRKSDELKLQWQAAGNWANGRAAALGGPVNVAPACLSVCLQWARTSHQTAPCSTLGAAGHGGKHGAGWYLGHRCLFWGWGGGSLARHMLDASSCFRDVSARRRLYPMWFRKLPEVERAQSPSSSHIHTLNSHMSSPAPPFSPQHMPSTNKSR